MRPYVAELSRIATCLTSRASERGPAERIRRLRRDARRDVRAAARVRPRRPPQHRRLAAAARRRSTPGPFRDTSRGLSPRHVPKQTCRGARFSGLEPFEIGRGHGVRADRRAHERHRLGALPAPDRERRLRRRAVDVALEQVRGGANLLDVNMDADLLEGEQAMRHVPERDRDRARGRAHPGDGRQLEAGRCSRPDCSACRARASSTRSR